jgi:hypothetical protein
VLAVIINKKQHSDIFGNLNKIMKTYAVTGTYHGSIVFAKTEGDARRLFHNQYNGESILIIKNISDYNLKNL